MFAKLIEDFPVESLRYTKTEGDNMYYVQIINPSDKEIGDAYCSKESEKAFISVSGGAVCL